MLSVTATVIIFGSPALYDLVEVIVTLYYAIFSPFSTFTVNISVAELSFENFNLMLFSISLYQKFGLRFGLVVLISTLISTGSPALVTKSVYGVMTVF